MKLTDRRVEKIQLIREIYTYDSLEEHEEHLFEMQLDGWQLGRIDRRKEYGYAAIFIKEEPLSEWENLSLLGWDTVEN